MHTGSAVHTAVVGRVVGGTVVELETGTLVAAALAAVDTENYPDFADWKCVPEAAVQTSCVQDE